MKQDAKMNNTKNNKEQMKLSATLKSVENQIEMCNRLNTRFGNSGFKPFRTDELIKKKQNLIKLLEI